MENQDFVFLIFQYFSAVGFRFNRFRPLRRLNVVMTEGRVNNIASLPMGKKEKIIKIHTI